MGGKEVSEDITRLIVERNNANTGWFSRWFGKKTPSAPTEPVTPPPTGAEAGADVAAKAAEGASGATEAAEGAGGAAKVAGGTSGATDAAAAAGGATEAVEGVKGLTLFGKFKNLLGKLGPLALLVAPTVEGVQGGMEASKEGKGAGGIAKAAAVGVGHGVVDTYLPGARDGYSDVIGHKDLTVFDRVLNGADHLSATVFAGSMTVTGAAAVATAVGVPTTGPGAIIPGAVTAGAAVVDAVSGLTNLGVNGVKAVTKVTGLAGKDQEGGYIYDAGKWAVKRVGGLGSWAYHGIGHLFGGGNKATEPSASALPSSPPSSAAAPNPQALIAQNPAVAAQFRNTVGGTMSDASHHAVQMVPNANSSATAR